ncbi:Vms1/Ankzf1 family peptidyl-tRNA hydrolase [Spirillospora sp. NPDC048911]|uniref:baeRF2 domain-containing protein n=1 Tax=Spirillospora sp. NPDC048911 TaxID=3364527 RepID=UPI0037141392
MSFLKSLYNRPGPFASVYADLTRTTEEAPKAPELRWRALREALHTEGAPEGTLRAIDETIRRELAEKRSEGLIVFAAGGEIAHITRLPDPPAAELARVSPLPHVLPLLAERGERFSYLLVSVDRRGGEITCVAPDGTRTTTHVEGDEDYPIRKVKAGDWNQSRFQRAAENTWKANAKKVGREVDVSAKQCGAELILLSGEPQARSTLMEEISDPLLERTVEAKDVDELLELKETERLMAIAERYEREFAHGERAVKGLSATVEAARRGQIETLLLPDDSPARVWVGPNPTEISAELGELHRMGVSDPVEERADTALIRAVAATDGDLALLHQPRIGAILRYSDNATRHQ